ncbi:MAG: cellulose binding domain-containing protein, partial [Ruminococcus sp.]
DTSIPPRYVDNIKCRYFFDISELIKAGQTIDDVQVDIFYDEENANTNGESFATISKPVKWNDDGMYYVEISWEGCEFYGKRVFHFGLIADMDENYETNWNPENDYSRQGIILSEDELLLTEYIPVYVDDKLVWGEEPPSDGNILYGDANLDGNVDIADAVAVSAYVGDSKNNSLEPQGLLNGDVQSNGNGLNANDALAIQQYLANIIKELPV